MIKTFLFFGFVLMSFYLFSGVFGFGGKFWANNYGELYANYYIEDQSLERELLLEKLNAELKEIQMEGGSSADKY